MARRASKDVCRFCGDISVVDDDTFKPTGLCAAHTADTVREAHKATRRARREDREVVVIREPRTPE